MNIECSHGQLARSCERCADECAIKDLSTQLTECQRSREQLDCRFAGQHWEPSGSHCPPGNPCLRCRLEQAERYREDNAAACIELAGAFKKAERERDAAEARADRLEARIREAPHDVYCASVRIKDDGEGPYIMDAYPPVRCNCWKAEE